MLHRFRGCTAVLAIVAAIGAVANAPAAPIIDPAHIKEHTLTNGLHIIVKEERGWGVVALGAYIRCGSLYDPADTPGVAHFLEHMLFRTGEEDGEPSELIATVEGGGGQINAETSRDSTLLHLVTSPQSLSKLWPTLARTLMEPQFDPDAVDRERRIIAQEMTEREGQAINTISEAVWAEAYPNHPYGNSVGGTPESLDKIDAKVLSEYHQRFYVPNNMALILCGDVDPEEAFTQIQEAFGGYDQRPVDWTPPEPDTPIESGRVDVETKPVTMTLIGLGYRGPGIMRKREVCAMDLIYTILGEGRSAWLDTEVEAKGSVTAFDLQFITHRDDGLVLVTAVAEPGKELEARDALLSQFARIAEEGVSQEDLDRAKRQLRNSYAFSNEAYSDQVGAMGFYEMIDTYRFAIDYIPAVDEVTVDDIKATARKYFNPDTRVLVIFRPPAPRKPGTEV